MALLSESSSYASFSWGRFAVHIPRRIIPRYLSFISTSAKGRLTSNRWICSTAIPRYSGLQTGDIHGVLKTSEGNVITEFDLSDPRYQLGDGVVISGNGTNLSLTGAASYSDTADFTLVMPYYPNQMTLDLSDKRTGSLLKSVNFSDAINRFRAMYPKDPGINPSQGFKIPLPVIQLPPKESPIYLEIGCGLIILFIIMLVVMTRKK